MQAIKRSRSRGSNSRKPSAAQRRVPRPALRSSLASLKLAVVLAGSGAARAASPFRSPPEPHENGKNHQLAIAKRTLGVSYSSGAAVPASPSRRSHERVARQRVGRSPRSQRSLGEIDLLRWPLAPAPTAAPSSRVRSRQGDVRRERLAARSRVSGRRRSVMNGRHDAGAAPRTLPKSNV